MKNPFILIIVVLVSLSVCIVPKMCFSKKTHLSRVNSPQFRVTKDTQPLLYSELLPLEVFLSQEIRAFDFYNTSSKPNSRVHFLKFAKLVPFETSIDLVNMILNDSFLREMFDAKKVEKIGNNKRSVLIGYSLFKGRPVSVSFEIKTRIVVPGQDLPEDEVFLELANSFDRNLPKASYILFSEQDNFNRIFYDAVSLLKLIPVEEKTLILGYTYTRVKDTACKTINNIPFFAAEKKIPPLFKTIVEDMYGALR